MVPKSTVSFLGARGESWFVVTACLRSAKWALATRHPNQARDASPVTNTTQLNVDQHGKGLEFSSMMSTIQYTENGVSPPLFWSGIISKIAITQDRTHRFPSFKAWASAQDAA